MVVREQYEEHSERDQQAVPLATYHFDQVIIPLHWHRELELILTQTPGVIELEGESYPYEAGDLLCVNKGVLHRTQEPMGIADLLVFDLRILFSPLISQNLSTFWNRLEDGSLLFPYRFGQEEPFYTPVAHSLQNAIQLVREQPENWELQLQMELLSFLENFWKSGRMQEASLRPYSSQTAAVKESITYMKRWYGQEITIGQLAEQAALSPSHYIRVFRRYTGQTPFAFLNDIRLEEAASCLRRGMTVTETAMQTGIPNISYFIRLFRSKFGQTPKQYQISQLSPH